MESKQVEIPTFGTVPDLEWLPEFLVVRCRGEGDAVSLCWAKRRRRGMTLRQASEELGIPASHLSNILSGKKYLPHDFRIRFQTLCGNWAIRQQEDHACGLSTMREDAVGRENRLLRARIEQMERQAA